MIRQKLLLNVDGGGMGGGEGGSKKFGCVTIKFT